MDQLFPWISIISLVLSSLSLLLYCFGNNRSERHKTESHYYPLPYVIGAFLIIVIVCMSAVFTLLIMIKPISDNTEKLVNMQSITLTITGVAISLIAIISSLRNYDFEKKGKEIEEELKSFVEKRKEQEAEFENLNDYFKENVKILFDSNSKDKIYLDVRIIMYEKALEKALEENKEENKKADNKSINLGLALIDALTQKKETANAKKREDINNQIISIVDSFYDEKKYSLEMTNLVIKKAISNYENAVVHVSKGKKDIAKAEIQSSLDIYEMLIKRKDLPMELYKHFKGNIGLCNYWMFRATDDETYLDESIHCYNACDPLFENNALIMNSLAVSKQNKARLEKNIDKKVELFYQVIDDYRDALRMDAKRERPWLNIASVYADLSHALIGVDIRERKDKFVLKKVLNEKYKELIKTSYTEGIKYIDKAMAINSGFVNNYYVYADLCCCYSIVSESKEEQELLLNESYKRLEHGLFFNSDAKEIRNVIYLFKKTILFNNLKERFPYVDLSEDDSKLN